MDRLKIGDGDESTNRDVGNIGVLNHEKHPRLGIYPAFVHF